MVKTVKTLTTFLLRSIVFTLILAPLLLIAEAVLKFIYLVLQHIITPLLEPISHVTIPTIWQLQALAISDMLRGTLGTSVRTIIFAGSTAVGLAMYLKWKRW